MIGIELENGKRLNVPERSTLEIERNSPFFSNNDEWAGERSTPITLRYTKENAQSLEHDYHFHSKRYKKVLDANLYDGTIFRQRGKLILEGSSINNNHSQRGEMRGYFVFALSNFYQIIKDKKLKSLILGGKRSYNWTTNNPNDASNGFWQWLHSTWAGNQEVVIAPIRNDSASEPLTISVPVIGTVITIATDWINKIGTDFKLDYNINLILNSICPQIRVKYIVDKIFEEHGYTVEYEVGDYQWEKLFLTSLIPFNWVNRVELPSWPFFTFQPKSTIDIYLAEHLPNKNITDFLVQLCNRYGWRLLIDDNRKVCRIKAVKTIRKGKRKDWSSYAAAESESDFKEGKKVFAFLNEVDSGDSLPIKGEFGDKTILPSVYRYQDLPTATGLIVNHVAYTYIENTYWIVQQNTDTQTYSWVPFSDNIFSFEPEGKTDTIETTMSTIPVARAVFQTVSGVDRYGIFPVMKQKFNLDFGFRTVFYHGVVPDELANGVTSTGSYPHLSSLWRIPGPADDDVWSNVFVQDYNDEKRGIIEYWFKDWINIISEGEDMKFVMRVPRKELMDFQWDDIILIRNIPFLVKSIIEPIPYQNKAEVTLRRIG